MKAELFNLLNSFKLESDKDKIENINVFKEYFNDFFKKYPVRDLFKVSNITYKEIITTILLIYNPYETIYVMDIISKYGEIFADNKAAFNLFENLALYFNDETFNEIINELKDPKFNNLFKTSSKVKSYIVSTGVDRKEIYKFAKFVYLNSDIVSQLELLFKNLELEVIYKSYEFYYTCSEFNKFIYEEFDKKEYARIKKWIEYLFKKRVPLVMGISSYLSLLYENSTKVIKELDNEIKNINKNNKKIKEIIAKLDIEGEIKDIAHILNMCLDEYTKKLVVDYILEHNNKFYESKIRELESLKKNSSQNFVNLFNKFGYDYNNLNGDERQAVKNIGFIKVEEIFFKLESLRIYSTLLDISQVNDFKLQKVEELITKGLITHEFVANNISVLYDNNILELIIFNISLLSKYDINIMNYLNSLDILLSDSLENNLMIVKDYGININKNTTNINFLINDNLQDKLDLIIMMGLYDELNSLDILNYSVKDLLKLRIANMLDVPLMELDNIDIDLDNKFSHEFVLKNNLEIFKREKCNEWSLPENLLEYQINKYVLNINGVFISIRKLLDNLNKFESISDKIIFDAIIYDSYYSFEEILKLQEALIPTYDFYTLVRR